MAQNHDSSMKNLSMHTFDSRGQWRLADRSSSSKLSLARSLDAPFLLSHEQKWRHDHWSECKMNRQFWRRTENHHKKQLHKPSRRKEENDQVIRITFEEPADPGKAAKPNVETACRRRCCSFCLLDHGRCLKKRSDDAALWFELDHLQIAANVRDQNSDCCSFSHMACDGQVNHDEKVCQRW